MSNDSDAAARELFGMVARRELTAAQAATLVAKLRAARASAPPAAAPAADGRIAIIGMAGRFPGADGIDAFWRLLAAGRSAVSPHPPARWGDAAGAAIAGGWLDDIHGFDHAFFGIPRREAEVMDPQQALFLESAWAALEHAGQGERDLAGRRVGVFVGAGAGDYASHLMARGAEPDGLSFMGNSNAILAGRIAYLLNLRGPCLTVDTACSSSLTAVHLARESLLTGGCDMAIAGGVCVLPTPTFARAAARAGMLSPTGTCRAFDAAADGFVPGEAVAALVLKPLDRALADGDHVWGVIEASGANQDGRTNGITAPSAPAQAALLSEVHDRWGIDPATIGYVEAHGTGTRLGDPIEVEALTRSFRRRTAEAGFCALGSVKPSVGHTMSAAGAVGIVKLLLALAHRRIPPSLNYAEPNPACAFPGSPFFVPTALMPWEERGGTRRGAVSAFGFSGSNVHIVIAEAPARPAPAAAAGAWPILLSAATPTALRALAAALADDAERQGEGFDLPGACWTLAAGRIHHRQRAAAVVGDTSGFVRALRAIAEGRPPADAAGDRALMEIVARYRAGGAVDPDTIAAPAGRRRVPLPTYPFERVSCALRPATRPRILRGLHPLLDTALPGDPVRYRTAIDVDEPFLADHKVDGRAILPGACIAAMALAAKPAAGLADITFRAPVGAVEAAGLVLRLEGDGFALAAEAAPDRTLAAGRYLAAAPAAPERIDLAAVRARTAGAIEGEALAGRFAAAGVALGPLFRGVRRLWLGDGEALAELTLSGEELAGLDAYAVHPTLLDGTFQAGMAALSAATPEAGAVLVPAGIGEVAIHAPVGPECLAHVVLAPDGVAADRARFQARLLDPDGNVLVAIRDFVALRLAPAAPAPAPAPTAAPVPLFVPAWRETAAAAREARAEGVTLIVRDSEDGGLGDALARAAGGLVLQVILGTETISRAVGVYEIDRADEAAMVLLLATMKPLAAVWVLGRSRPVAADAAALDAAATEMLLPRLRCLQALAGLGERARDVPVLLVTVGAQAADAGEVPDAGAAMLAGLGTAAAREVAPLKLGVVDLSPAELAAASDALAGRLLAEPVEAPGRIVALRGERRLLRTLVAAPAPDGAAARFKDGGAYVIVGGAGGLGLALARHLAERHAARLLLIGRSPLSASQQRAIAAIEAAGGTVLHVRADAADPAQLDAALAEGRRRFGRFDGAVQAAMVLRDGPLMALDAAGLATVLAPKLAATANLARALAPDRPDMLVIFSSANAFIGNRGQANYAAAAAGQDALGLALRAAGMPVTVIDWGYWGEVGAVAAPVYLERAARLGIGAIGIAEGIAALETVLARGLPQAMAMKVSAEALTALGIPAEAAPAAEAPAAETPAAETPAAETPAAETPAAETPAAETPAPEADALTAQFAAFEAAARDRLAGMFQRAGFLQAPGQSATVEELKTLLAVVPIHLRLFDAVLDILERGGLLLRRGDRLEVTDAVLDPATAIRMESPGEAEAALEAEAPWLVPFIAVTRRCLERYADALAGRIAATELLFPGGSTELVAPLYRDNPIADHFNGAVVAAVLDAARARAGSTPFVVTEVGAGTGGTAVAVMQALADAGIDFRYRFTDLSPTLVRGARAALARRFPGAEFAVLDLERPLADALRGGSDVVVAVNVLHATADVGFTSAICRALLRPGGLLVLNEAVRRRDFATLVFGLTDGWWRFRDGQRRLPHSPLLDRAGWRATLAEAGFGSLAVTAGADPEDAQAVMVATAGQAIPAQAAAAPIRAEALEPMSPAPTATGTGAALAVIRRALAEALRVPLDTIEDGAGFAALGVDSIVGVDLMERISVRLGVSVPMTALFDHPSPAALAVYLTAEHPTLPAFRTAAPAAQPSLPASLPTGAVAIVGMAGSWPGAADTDAFWRNLAAGVASIGEPPPGRWPGAEPATGAWSRGGFLDAVDRFEPLFFEMSGIEADHTDPQARLFLTTAWHALEDAGWGPAALDGRRCGVFVGAAAGDYPSGAVPGATPPPHAFMGNAQSVLAGRIAYLLNLRGPTLAVDTACSSSLVALHLACRAILDGECAMALAGGVFVTSTPAFHRLTATLGMTSPRGTTRAFDDGADGFVPGEGVGVVVLRRLEDAVADGDRILGVVRATGVNSDGRTHGMTAPSARAQADLVADVLARAGLPAAALDYVEAHGTGTPLGDPIEVEALARVLGAGEAPGARCLIGSVKTNIGHAGPAAGMAGLQKVLLALRHETLPASLNFATPNRHIDFTAAPVAVCDRPTPWPRRVDRPRRAGVSGFGLSGTNAHAVIEEAPAPRPRAAIPAGPWLFPISARTGTALARRIADLAAWLDGAGRDAEPADIAWTLAIGRRHFAHRRVFVAADRAGLRRALVNGAQLADALSGPLAAARADYLAGGDPDWRALHAGLDLRRVPLPVYPFEGAHHWVPVVAAPQPRPAPARLYAPVWEAAPPPAIAGAGEFAVLDDQDDLAAALAAHGRVVRRTFGEIALAPVIVVRPPVAHDPVAAATAMLALARAADDGVKRRVLIVVPEQGGAGAEAAAAATALEPALRSAVAWSVLRTGAGIPVRDLAAAVAVEAAAGEAEVLLRGDDRLARRMRPLALSGAGGLPGDAVCWIVGGSGAIGTALAGHLRRRHGARVVLSSRHAPADAAAEFLPLDVRDAAAVAAAAAEIRARHGRIDAVFHLAGAMRRAPLAGAAPEAVAEVLGAKMAGAVHLHRATAADRLSAFVLFSSLAGELGDFGQGDYALANRFLGNFAAARRGPGGSLAIAWPVWRDGRMAAPGRERDAALAASGLDALETEAALDALDALLGADGPVAVLAAGGRDPFTAPVPRAVAMAGPGPLAEVRGLLAAELHLPAAEIADDAPFGTLGLDSLHVRGFAERLTARFGTPVAPSELFGLSTVRALAAHLGAAAPAPLPAMTVATPAAPTPAPVRRAGAAEPIAIIGMAGRFPGASDIDAFWAALAAGHDLVGEVPADRWDWRAQRLPDGTAVPRWGGFIDGVDRFDAGFFGISAREAAYLDPQARLLLETAWHALEDAAVPPGMLAGTAAGVFVGSQLADYAELVGDAGEAAPQAVLGNTRTMLANRLSHALDLRGPSEAVDTACSSSLVAIHRAVRSLREGESDLALTGGTHLILTPRAQALGAQLGMLSSTGRCRTFDAAADGYVRGEGVAVVVLKRLADAERDGDPIRAVILESGENHGGRASGLTAPNPQAQADLIAGVLRRAGVPLASIGHVEAHGTGTALGDPIEVDALNQAFARITAERGEVPPAAGSCRLSSVKSSIGHLEPASGVAGLVKSVLALERGALPATLHVARVNPLLRLDGGPFRLVTETEPWPAPAGGGPRRACVSSFGLGGSNAHVLLETAAPRHRAADMDGPAIVPLSARDPAALRRVAERIAAWLPATDAAWPDIVATLRSGREAMAARLAVVASSPGDLARRLGAWLAGEGGGCVAGAVDRDGLSALFDTPEDAADLVARAVDQGRPERLLRLWVAGVPVDWRRVPAPVGGRRRSLPGYPFAADRHWFDRRPRAAAPAPAPAVPPPPVAAPAPAFSPSADAVRTRLCTVVADALYLDAAALDIDANLVELGVDSILAVEIARKLQDAFAITLPATRLYDAPTIRRLAALIAEGAGDAAAPPAEPIPAPPPSPAPGGDVLARLNALLAETLYLEPGAIDPDQPFTEIGLDSILAVELARRIEGEFGVALRATRLYDQPTPRGLAVALAAELGAATQSPVATAPTAPAVPDDPILARLRDKVAAMLSLDPGHVETDLGLVEFGLDRYAAGELARFVTAELGVAMDEAALFRADGLAALARQIAVAGTRPRAAPAPAAPADSRAVAVIGMAGRFPGAPDLDTFWRNLRDGVDSVTEVPPGRFAIDEWYDPDPQTPNRTYCRHGGFLTGVEDFDPRFFGISPAEARIIDPQQRLFLEAAWHALEDAGLPDHALDGAACAVFVGCSAGDYAQRAATRVSAQFGMGNVGSILAARIAYHLNLRGPAVAVDTACSSSLVAVHLACQSLASGECDVAIAGGVALMTTPAMHLLTCQARMLSPEGRCKTFDASADGFVPAEGVGAVVLKPLARALADGDRILGVVEATGTNQDGRSNGLTAPSLAAQRALESGVWERHGIDPASLGYVEAHGTGTKLGDPIELQALTDAFRRSSDAVGTCAIGSVKTNIGHAVPAAGVAGLIKTLLQLRHRTIAPSLHLVTPNPQIDLATSPFRVPRRAEPWAAPATGGPRRAAVNSFGFSGTNAHVVVAEAPERPAPPAAGGPFLFLLSGKTPDALRQRRAELRAWLEAASPDPHDLAHTLAAGRSHFRHRAAFVAGDIAELAAALAADDRAEAAPHGDEAGGMAALAAAGDAAGRRAALELLARAYRGGASLRGLYPRGSARLLAAPLYPFQRQRCWIDEAPGESKPAETGHTDTARHLGAADPLLAQHVVQGRALLPAAASLEMLLEAGPGALADIRWLRPAVADATGLTLAVEAEGDGLALLAGGARHAVARRAGVGESPPRLDLAALRADLRQPVAPDALYGRLARLGIAYGPAFRCVTALRRADDGSALLADLAPAVPGGAFLVDAALHAIAGLTDASDADGAVPLPTAMARAVAHGKLSDIRHAHVRRVGAGAFDATLTDGEGRVLLVIEGFAAERPAAGAPGAAGALAFYRSHWDRAKPTVIAPARPALLLHGIGSEALAAAVAALPGGAPCRVLALGDPAVAAAVTALPSDSHVVLLGGTSTDTDEIAAVMRSLQALILADRPARVTVVSRSATEAGVPPPNWRGAALLGLAKVAMREARRLAIATIDVGNDDCPSTAAAIAAEPAQRPGPRDAAADVAWRDGRMTRILDRVPAPGAATGIRDGGVYVIVGGGRGIGAALAHRLAAAHRARLVLVGRSPASSASDGLCAELAAAGGDAVYLAADCADVVAMAAVRDAAVARFGAVHGVVHSAFVMADGALPAMSVDRLAAALRPKLDGTAAIAEAFADSGLDFLALLSSTVATTATAGQANYAAAAMAQDAAGRWLGRDGGLPVRTIGWGFWGEVGRVADEVHRNRLRGTGVAAIGTEEGIDALLAVLGAGWPAVSVLKLADDAPARASTASDVAPAALRDLVIGTLAAVLELRAEEVADGDELAAIGLDSIGMVDVQERLESGLSALPSTLLAGVRTVGELVARVAAHASGTPAAAPPQCAEAIAIRGAGTGTPGFWVPSFIGEAGWVRHLADAFGTTRPTWLLRPGDVAAAPNLAAVGAALADAVAAVHAGGPVILGGYSYGGVLAVDAAAILRARGVPVERVVLLDSFAPGSSALSATLDAGEPPDLPVAVASVLARGWGLRAPIAADGTDIAHLADAVRAACDTAPPAAEVVRLIEADLAAIRRMRVLLRDHRPDAGAGGLPVTLLRARRAPDAGGSAMPLDAAAAAVFRADGADDHGWSTWLGVAPEIVPVDADHFGLGEPAVLAVLARHLAGGSRRDAVLDVVRRHTVAVLAGVSPEAVTLDVSLRDLGANSIDRVEIATLAMAELDADIPRRRLAAVSDLASLVDLLVEFSAAP